MAVEERPGGGKSGNGFSLKKTLLEFAVVTVVAASCGVVAFGLAPKPNSVPREEEQKPAHAGAPSSPGVVDLPPIVTNLGSPTEVWVRLEGALLLGDKPVPHPESLAGEIAADLLAYLRTTSLEQIEGPIGFQNLRREFNERAALRSQGQISEVLIRTLVVQ